MLIGISGYIGSGKDTVAKIIQAIEIEKRNPGFFSTPKPHANEVGHPNFGKRTTGLLDYIQTFDGAFLNQSQWQIKKFAGKLKQIVSLLTGIPVANLEEEKVKQSELSPEWNWWYFYNTLGKQEVSVPFNITDLEMFRRRYEHIGADKMYQKPMTVRELLQRLGTDAMRDKVHPNVHINALFADYKEDWGIPEADQFPNWIISDLRFPNEFQAIKDRGGICIRVNRGPGPIGRSKELHASETALDQAEFDYVIENSGTLEELLEQVRTMLLHFEIIK